MMRQVRSPNKHLCQRGFQGPRCCRPLFNEIHSPEIELSKTTLNALNQLYGLNFIIPVNFDHIKRCLDDKQNCRRNSVMKD